MRLASITLMTAITAFAGSSSTAEEKQVHLRQAPGLDKVEAHCSACHSLDYVQMNSRSAAGWEAEVAKMINAFGAQIDEADAKIIADYLSKNYGIESSSLGKDEGFLKPTSSNLESAASRVMVRTSSHASFKRRIVLHNRRWVCPEMDRLIFGSSCSPRPPPAFAWSARRGYYYRRQHIGPRYSVSRRIG